jgi:hypothetical protein
MGQFLFLRHVPCDGGNIELGFPRPDLSLVVAYDRPPTLEEVLKTVGKVKDRTCDEIRTPYRYRNGSFAYMACSVFMLVLNRKNISFIMKGINLRKTLPS